MSEKVVVTKSYLENIGKKIIDKGGASSPLLPSQMAAAIEAIPTGGGDPNAWSEWFTPPPSWPHLPNILKNDTEPYTGKIVILWSIEIGLTVTIPTGGQKVVFGDGTVYTSGFGGSHTFAALNQKTHYAVVYSNSSTALVWTPVTAGKVLAIVGNKDIRFSVSGRWSSFSNNNYLAYVKMNADGCYAYNLTRIVAWELPDGVESIPIEGNQYFYKAHGLKYFCKTKGSANRELSNQRDSPFVVFPDEFSTGGSNDSNWTTTFNSARYLRRLPQYLCVNVSMSFINCVFVEKDSVAKFDDSGKITGGFVKTLRSWDTTVKDFVDVNPVDGQTITLSDSVKGQFTDDEWLAIYNLLQSKNWGLSPMPTNI